MNNRNRLVDVERSAERGFLVGVEVKRNKSLWRVEDSLEELAQLARTAGIQVIGTTIQRLSSPTPATFIGSGKVEELKAWAAEQQPDVIVFDEELSPGQQKNLENQLQVKILDRTALILDIFAQHAHTHEGALQVELAQYEYRLPRLTRLWTHLARQAGGGAARGGPGGVGLRGPGETQLEVDRREIRRHIAHLKRELEEVRTHRRLYRQRRRKAQVPVVAILGYTNAGKSTLLNALSGAGVHVEDKLFATLDPTTRRVELPDGRSVLFTDTVGFIQKLPTQLVAAFRATLEEINEADLILHIVDISHPNVREQARAVEDILRDLGVTDTPMVVALNKIDLLPGMDGDRVEDGIDQLPSLRNYPNTIPISAARGIGLDRLLARISQVLAKDLVPITVVLPYKQDGLLKLFHERGVIHNQSYTPHGVRIAGKIPRALQARFAEYIR